MSLLSGVMRIKLVIFAVICFVLWEALRTVPRVSSFSNSEYVTVGRPTASLRSEVIPVEVAVYYESLCPDSRSFVTKQLLPAVEAAPELIKAILVPYGKAETRQTPEGYEFSCQHGPKECYGNKIHSCAVALIRNQDLQVKYIACMISNNVDPEDIAEKCANTLGFPSDDIIKCARGAEGSQLLKANGDATYALNPSVTFIPTITLQGSQGNQAAILKNLLGEVCKQYKDPVPHQCL